MDVNAEYDGKSDDTIVDFQPGTTRSGKGGGNRQGKRPYRAYEADITNPDGKGDEAWLRIHYQPDGPPDSMEMYRYTDILKLYSPIPDVLSIVCEDAAFELVGKYLSHEIPILLQDRKLCALYCYNPEEYLEPEAGAPIILQINRMSRSDEEDQE